MGEQGPHDERYRAACYGSVAILCRRSRVPLEAEAEVEVEVKVKVAARGRGRGRGLRLEVEVEAEAEIERRRAPRPAPEAQLGPSATPDANRASTSAAVYPASARYRAVCSPSRGAVLRTFPGRLRNLIGTPT